MDSRLLDYQPEIDAFERLAPEPPERRYGAAASETQAALELLGRVDDGELEAYLVELIDSAARPRQRGITAALAALLASAARRLLWPSDARCTARTGPALGLELEGLSPEDQLLQVSRQLVRLTSLAARHASADPGAGSPRVLARRAAVAAARELAPGLLASAGARSEGIWFRRGRTLVVLGS